MSIDVLSMVRHRFRRVILSAIPSFFRAVMVAVGRDRRASRTTGIASPRVALSFCVQDDFGVLDRILPRCCSEGATILKRDGDIYYEGGITRFVDDVRLP